MFLLEIRLEIVVSGNALELFLLVSLLNRYELSLDQETVFHRVVLLHRVGFFV